MRDEQLHAVVARGTFPSQNVQNKHTRSGPLLEAGMSKKCTPLWHEAHFEVKMLKIKTAGVRTTFGNVEVKSAKKLRGFGALFWVQMLFRVAGARDCVHLVKSEQNVRVL